MNSTPGAWRPLRPFDAVTSAGRHERKLIAQRGRVDDVADFQNVSRTTVYGALAHEITCVGVAMSQRSAGLNWFRATYPKLTDGIVRVSRYYPPGKSTWKHDQPTWAFEFPLKYLESAVSVTYCVCQKEGGGFYCLRVPHQHVLDHRAALYERIDKSGRPSIGVFLAADPSARFRDVRGTDGIDFGQFLLPDSAT
jgi:hypothetical protein